MDDKKKQEVSKNLSQSISSSDELSYIDYLIEKKFYRKFWKTLKIIGVSFSVLLATAAFFGIQTYFDLNKKLSKTDSIYKSLEHISTEYKTQEIELNFRKENSNYYSFWVQCEYSKSFAWEIETILGNCGFRESTGPHVDDSLGYLLFQTNFFTENNPGIEYLKGNRNESKYDIAVVYNGVPKHIRDRIKSIFCEYYDESEVKFFQDSRIPEAGFIYYVD